MDFICAPSRHRHKSSWLLLLGKIGHRLKPVSSSGRCHQRATRECADTTGTKDSTDAHARAAR
eukprot:1753926-Prorocentrum_lima.AAC.1